jgi:hypothetical protein
MADNLRIELGMRDHRPLLSNRNGRHAPDFQIIMRTLLAMGGNQATNFNLGLTHQFLLMMGSILRETNTLDAQKAAPEVAAGLEVVLTG